MSRTGSGGRSFLDELLADDLDKPNTTSKRKSVRFMDSDEENSDIFATNLMSSAANRQTSAKDRQRIIDPLERPKNDALSGKQKNSTKSDWLGLDNDDEPNRPNAQTYQEIIQKPAIDQKDDWLNTGLSARKNRSTTESSKSATDPIERNDDNSWTTIRKRAEESKLKIQDQKEDKTQQNDNKIAVNTVTPKVEPDLRPTDKMQNLANISALDETLDTSISSVNTSSVMLLKTQIKMLELEKTYLQQTLEQIKSNHSQEMKIMTELHEQQMQMTTDMYKRHEDMIQEERDRRISDLKAQLSQSERDMEDMRRRHSERVEYLENEWQREVERLKASHTSVTQKISEEHEHDLTRIRRIKEQEIESVNALQNHGLSLETLLSKWENSAKQIEELHKNVISKQEEILKHKLTDIEVKNKQLDEVGVNWHSLINELEVERNRCTSEQKKLYETLDQQKQLIQSEQKRLFEERLDLESIRKKLAEERVAFDGECNRVRDHMKKESDLLSEERLKAKDEFTNLEIRRNEQNIKELDSQQNLNKERQEIKQLFKDIEEKRNEIHREESSLHHTRISLQSEQHSLEQRKLLFDIERVKMQDLAQEIAKRAEELESLGEIALHEKREGHMAMDEAEKFRVELDSKLKFIENSFTKLRAEEEKMNKMKAKVEQELDFIKETKDNIVCNLCSSGLNRVKLNGMTRTSLQDMANVPSFYGSNQWSGLPDDRALLIWQITGQQDAALLQQETAFINAIRTQTLDTDITFQQNEYFIN